MSTKLCKGNLSKINTEDSTLIKGAVLGKSSIKVMFPKPIREREQESVLKSIGLRNLFKINGFSNESRNKYEKIKRQADRLLGI